MRPSVVPRPINKVSYKSGTCLSDSVLDSGAPGERNASEAKAEAKVAAVGWYA